MSTESALLRFALAATLAAVASNATAMNRCVDAQGKVSYTDRPCDGAEQQSRVKIVDSKGFNPERRSSRRVEASAPAFSADRAPPQHAGAQSPQAAFIGEPSKLDYSQRVRCNNVRGDYESMRSKSIPAPSAQQMAHARGAAEQACQQEIPVSDEERKVHAAERIASEGRAMAAQDAAGRLQENEHRRVDVSCNGGRCSDSSGNEYRPLGGNPAVLQGPRGQRCTMRPMTNRCD
jgi:hypothetical protein